MNFTTVGGIIAGLVLIAAFVLAIMDKMPWALAAMFIGLAVAVLLHPRGT